MKPYSSSDKNEWDDFVSKSKNATFLFHRDFMDYHKDRFEDFSLMVYKKDKLVSLLPANRVGNEIYSHQGLSYGGILLTKMIKFKDVLLGFEAILQFLVENAIQKLNLKLLPKIYHNSPSDEIHYLLFLLKAKIIKIETLIVIDQTNRMSLSKDRINGIKRGEKNGLIIKEETEFDDFWNEILTSNLKLKHGELPVHSSHEIKLLHQKFPKKIRQFNVYRQGKLVAGTTIFVTERVAHCQYISANLDKNKLGSLDFLHHHLITSVFKDKPYYDFGSSNETNGLQINEGLQYWKEGFGGRTIIHEFYSVETEGTNLLNSVFK